MKSILLSTIAFGLVSCAEDIESTSNITSTAENKFSAINLLVDGIVKFEKNRVENEINEIVKIQMTHSDQTSNGKPLYDLNLEIDRQVTDGSTGYSRQIEELYDLECKKSYKSPILKRGAIVTCDAVFVTDQRSEMIFGAPKAKLTLKEQLNGKVTLKLDIDKGYAKNSYKIRNLDYSKVTLYL